MPLLAHDDESVLVHGAERVATAGEVPRTEMWASHHPTGRCARDSYLAVSCDEEARAGLPLFDGGGAAGPRAATLAGKKRRRVMQRAAVRGSRFGTPRRTRGLM